MIVGSKNIFIPYAEILEIKVTETVKYLAFPG